MYSLYVLCGESDPSVRPPAVCRHPRKLKVGNRSGSLRIASQKIRTSKRLRKSLEDSAVEPLLNEEGSQHPSGSKVDPIDYWTKEGSWPKAYFEQDEQIREYFNRDIEEESWFRKYWLPNMEHI